jgi:hypothetical protein
MENNKPAESEENKTPDNPSEKYLPVDPSNTSHLGQKKDTGVIGVDKGLAEQSNEWEDAEETDIPDKSLITPEAEGYLKKPSPEEKETGSEIRENMREEEDEKN